MKTSTSCNPKISPLWAILAIAGLFGFAWLMSGFQAFAHKMFWLLVVFSCVVLGSKILSLLALMIIRPFLRR